MRKKLFAIVLTCICLFSLAACSSDSSAIDYNGKSFEELKEYSVGVWEELYATDASEITALITYVDGLADATKTALMEEDESLESTYLLYQGWEEANVDLGEYLGIGDFSVVKSSESTTAELTIEFENRSVLLSVVYKNRNMSVESTTVELIYSMGEKLQKAALNTVMGMGTVFLMLIVISLIISCFSFIPKIEKMLKEKKEPKAPVAAEEQISVEEEEVDSLELVAVIAAAIAAYTGQSTDDFVVRSIKRR